MSCAEALLMASNKASEQNCLTRMELRNHHDFFVSPSHGSSRTASSSLLELARFRSFNVV